MFEKGNPGKPKGAKSERVKQWETLAEDITGQHAERFNRRMKEMMEHEDDEIALRGLELYVKVMEYFKPKQARIQHAGNDDGPINIIISPNL